MNPFPDPGFGMKSKGLGEISNLEVKSGVRIVSPGIINQDALRLACSPRGVCVCVHSVMANSFVTAWTVILQAPLPMGSSR